MRFDRILGDTVEALDAQMLFDPFEEQLDLPAATIELSEGQRGQIEVVGQKDPLLVVFGIVEFDAAQVLRVILSGFGYSQYDSLIAAQSRRFVHGTGVEAPPSQI